MGGGIEDECTEDISPKGNPKLGDVVTEGTPIGEGLVIVHVVDVDLELEAKFRTFCAAFLD